MSDSLHPHELQNARPPCPSPTPRVHPNPCPSSRWCHPTISSCHPLLLLPSIFPSIRVFSNESALHVRWPEYWSFSFSISPSNKHPGPISFRWTGWISLQSKGLSRVFSNTTVQKHNSSVLSFLYSPTLTSIHDYWKNHSLNYTDFVGKVMSLFFNMLSRLVITFLPRNKCLLISWLQSPSAVICGPKKYSQPREVSMGHFKGKSSKQRNHKYRDP